MMIGVYNHLRNARYLGSITILRRWARIPTEPGNSVNVTFFFGWLVFCILKWPDLKGESWPKKKRVGDHSSGHELNHVEQDRLHYLGGGNSNIFGIFTPENWGKMNPSWRAFFRGVGSTTNQTMFFEVGRLYNSIYIQKALFFWEMGTEGRVLHGCFRK